MKLPKLPKLPKSLPKRKVLTRFSAVAILIGALAYGLLSGNLKAGWGPDEKVTKSEKRDNQGKIVETVTTKTVEDSKTLWDWLSLLGVPLSLALLAAWLQQIQQKQADKQEGIEKKIAEENQREEALQEYIDRVSNLLIDKNLLAIAAKLKDTTEETNLEEADKELLDASVDVIRARTLSILRRLRDDGERKGDVIRFLVESEVVYKLKLRLSGADLSRANLSSTYLWLRGADISNANLNGADLRGADISNANLSDANFSFANLSFANFRGAIIKRPNFKNLKRKPPNFSTSKIIRSNLSGSNLSRANLKGADLSHANLDGANLKGADLSTANLSKTSLLGADIRDANLSEAQLTGAKLFEVNLSGAILPHADLIGSNLSRANLSGTNLSCADLIGSNLSRANLNGANLSGADLNGANLSRANLSGTNLSCADLSGADLNGADLSDARRATPERVKEAENWQKAIYDDQFRQELGLPADKP